MGLKSGCWLPVGPAMATDLELSVPPWRNWELQRVPSSPLPKIHRQTSHARTGNAGCGGPEVLAKANSPAVEGWEGQAPKRKCNGDASDL